jgi:SAM-dependent methyltransferase
MDCLFCDNLSTTAFAHLGERRYFRCPQCQLVFLDPQQRLDSAGEKAHYDLHENDPDDPNYRAFLRRLSNPLVEKLHRGSYGLDYGCGPGPALAPMLSERGFVMDIYDPLYFNDESLLENQYDFITCTEVVEHFHSPREEFARFDSLLRPGGWLAIMTSWLTEDIDFSRWHYPRDPTHVCFYSQETFLFWARQHNWHIEMPDDNVVLLQKPEA